MASDAAAPLSFTCTSTACVRCIARASLYCSTSPDSDSWVSEAQVSPRIMLWLRADRPLAGQVPTACPHSESVCYWTPLAAEAEPAADEPADSAGLFHISPASDAGLPPSLPVPIRGSVRISSASA